MLVAIPGPGYTLEKVKEKALDESFQWARHGSSALTGAPVPTALRYEPEIAGRAPLTRSPDPAVRRTIDCAIFVSPRCQSPVPRPMRYLQTNARPSPIPRRQARAPPPPSPRPAPAACCARRPPPGSDSHNVNMSSRSGRLAADAALYRGSCALSPGKRLSHGPAGPDLTATMEQRCGWGDSDAPSLPLSGGPVNLQGVLAGHLRQAGRARRACPGRYCPSGAASPHRTSRATASKAGGK